MTSLRLILAILLLLPVTSTLTAQNRPFSFIAIGDAGQAGAVLDASARSLERTYDRQKDAGSPVGLLLFLGDNFYPIGLNRNEADVRRLINGILIEPYRRVLTALGPANVHAVAGNHDYYCNMLGPAPYGTCITGNRVEDSIPEWSFHHIMPTRVRRAISEGSSDSIEFILYDSALPIAVHPNLWGPGIDSLERLLRRGAGDRSVRWRILAAHHSPYTVGEHGGWRGWSDEEKRVTYLGNCIQEGQDPRKYPEEFFSNQDNCDPQYRAWNDSLFAVIDRSGARVHLLMAGHDHSLQAFTFPDGTADFGYPTSICANCPKSYIISGAGSKRARVRGSNELVYTHPVVEDEGKSAGGFVVGTVERERIVFTFIEAESGEPLEMGGATTLELDAGGNLMRGSK